jgi:hypothetical protein
MASLDSRLHPVQSELPGERRIRTERREVEREKGKDGRGKEGRRRSVTDFKMKKREEEIKANVCEEMFYYERKKTYVGDQYSAIHSTASGAS